jgi:hypothetical protein
VKATHHEEFTFFVTSDAGKPDYIVDMLEYDGIGKCTCPDFACKKEPRLVAGERTKAFRCKHIRAASEALSDLVIARVLQSRAEL